MTLSAPVLKRLISLHGWSGTVLSILLYVVMLTGTVVVFDNEIHRWSRGAVAPFGLTDSSVEADVRGLVADVPAALTHEIVVNTNPSGYRRVFFSGHLDAPGQQDWAIQFLMDRKGAVVERLEGTPADIRNANDYAAYQRFLVDLHVRLHIPEPWGLYLTGLLGFVMLIAAITGVLIHKHILRDVFVAARPGTRLVSVRDRHTLAGVWGLPFAAVLAFTGAFLSFAISLGLPVVAFVAFGGDQVRAIEAALGSGRVPDMVEAQMADLDTLIARAAAQAGVPPTTLLIEDYGTRGAEVRTFHGQADGRLTGRTLIFNGVTGALDREGVIVGSEPSIGSTAVDVMTPLHFGNFAGLVSQAVWAGLGAAMTYSIVSGMLLWLRRREDDPGWARCRTVLVCTVWGLPFAMATSGIAFFLGLPFGVAWQATPLGFVAGAFAMIAWAAGRMKHDLDQLGRSLRYATGVTLALLPVLRITIVGPGWSFAAAQLDHAVYGVDFALWFFAFWLLWPLAQIRGRFAHAAGGR
ncbi:MAG: PepSY-associated TM helix domain-containing protein [Pseudomonadota bacterium]